MKRLTEKEKYGYASLETGQISECSNKLGKLEDIFKLIEEMYKKPVGWKDDTGEEHYDYYTNSIILYNPTTNEIEVYEYEFVASYKVEEYGITWWLKEDKSD